MRRLQEIHNLAASLPPALRSDGDSKRSAEAGSDHSTIDILPTANTAPKGLVFTNVGAGLGVDHSANLKVTELPDLPVKVDMLSEETSIRGIGTAAAIASTVSAVSKGCPGIGDCCFFIGGITHIIEPKKTREFYVSCANYAGDMYQRFPSQRVNAGLNYAGRQLSNCCQTPGQSMRNCFSRAQTTAAQGCGSCFTGLRACAPNRQTLSKIALCCKSGNMCKRCRKKNQ